ncbi:MAG: methyltransferase domain-containing protein [Ktedonobacteraceae bacterium]|nr:methyltransferase domain-containing protein [Ktedonobacteraceae bacterium]
MDQSSGNDAKQSSNFIMEENSTQLAWLFNLDSNLTRIMGGLFPERDDDLEGIHSVLDLGCGSGGWALEIARLYPHIEVTGVDINRSLIEYVRAHAKAQNIKNAHYQITNILEPLPFPDASFDLVNARTLYSSLKPSDWPPLLRECNRILRPGGTLRLTEMERHLTSDPANERMWDTFTHALYVSGRSFSPDGHHIGIVPHLGRLLREAGFQHTRNRASTPEISAQTANFGTWREQDTYAWQLVEPFLVKSGMATQEEVQEMRAQTLQGFMSEGFCAIAFFFTCWGEKP